MWKSFLSYAALVIFKVKDYLNTPDTPRKNKGPWR